MASIPASHRACVGLPLLLGLLLCSILQPSGAHAAQQPRTPSADISHLRAQKLFVRGMTQSYLEDYEEAVAYFEKALDLSPETPSILMALAETEAARENVTSALYYARQARDRAPDRPYYYRKLAELLQQADRPGEAEATYRTLLDSFPDNRPARLALARLQANRQDYEEALRTYETLVDSSKRPRQAQVYAEMLNLYRQVDDADGQERVLKILIDLRRDARRYRRLLGQLYIEQERYEEALPHFETLLRKTPTSPQLLSRLKMLYDRTGQSEKAETLWKRFEAKEASPNQLVARARSLYNDARSSDPSPDSSVTETAVQLLKQVLDQDSTHVNALSLLGTIYYDTGAYARAAAVLDRATDANPRAPDRWQKAASAHLKAGHPQRARRVAEEGLLLFPGRPALLRSLGTAHLQLGNNESALSRFQKALDNLDPSSKSAKTRAALHADLGLAHDRLGNPRQAETAYETALELNPQQPKALRHYARSLAQRKTQLDRALQLAQRAVENNPSNPKALATLAWVHFRRGAVSEARSTFSTALETGRAPAAVYEQFGDLHRSLGNDSLAQQYWKEAFNRAPERDSLQKKLQTLPES